MQEQYKLTPQEVAEAIAQYVGRKLAAEGRPITTNTAVQTSQGLGGTWATVTFER